MRNLITILMLLSLSAGAQELTNKNATLETKDLYEYMWNLGQSTSQTNKLISGHWLGASFYPNRSDYPFNMGEVTEIRRHSGKWVGMIDAWICPGEFGKMKGFDPIKDGMWYDHMIADYDLWWRNGGICHIDASFFAPLADEYWWRFEKKVTKQVNNENIFVEGTGENRRWIEMCDKMSEFFLALQQRDIPVIFRPFTEAYIAHFWYSNKRLGNENFKKLYRQLYDYLTVTKGCNNIIWDFQGELSSPHYPGDAYVDLLTAKSDYVTWASCCNQCIAPKSGKVVGNGELGDYGKNAKVKPEDERPWESWIEKTKEVCREMTFYTVWDRVWGPVKKIDEKGTYPSYDMEYNAAINNPYVITRDEIECTPKAPALPYMTKCDVTKDDAVRFSFKESVVALYGNTDWENYTAQTAFKQSVTGVRGVIGRATSVTIYYAAKIGDGKFTLEKCFNGQTYKLAETPFKAPRNAEIVLSVTFDGSKITTTAEYGSEKKSLSATDESIPVGCAGVYSDRCSAEFSYLKAN